MKLLHVRFDAHQSVACLPDVVGLFGVGVDVEEFQRRREEVFRRIEHVDAAEARAVGGRDQIERAVILQPPHVAPPDLLGQAIDYLDAGEVAFVHGAVEGLPGERLLVHGAVGIAVEEAAEFVLQLADTHLRLGDECPGEILVVEPAAPLDRVHEMTLGRIAGGQRHVVAALHHAGAAAFAEQALHRDGDVEFRPRLLRMQRREQAGAAGAQNQNVGVENLHAATVAFSLAPAPVAPRTGTRAKPTATFTPA